MYGGRTQAHQSSLSHLRPWDNRATAVHQASATELPRARIAAWEGSLNYKSEGLNLENLLMPAHALEGGVGGVENYAVRKLTEQVRRSSSDAMPPC